MAIVLSTVAIALLLLGNDSLPVGFAVIAVIASLLAWLVVLKEEDRGNIADIRLIAVAIGALMLLAIALSPMGSHDVWSYTMYGRMVSQYGVSPYSHVPQNFPHDPFLPLVAKGWRHTSSVYGPVFVVFSALGSALAGGSALLAALPPGRRGDRRDGRAGPDLATDPEPGRRDVPRPEPSRHHQRDQRRSQRRARRARRARRGAPRREPPPDECRVRARPRGAHQDHRAARAPGLPRVDAVPVRAARRGPLRRAQPRHRGVRVRDSGSRRAHRAQLQPQADEPGLPLAGRAFTARSRQWSPVRRSHQLRLADGLQPRVDRRGVGSRRRHRVAAASRPRPRRDRRARV